MEKKQSKKRKPSLTLGLVSDEGGLVLHHRVDGQLLVVLGRDDGHGGLVGARLHGHVLHHLHLCERRTRGDGHMRGGVVVRAGQAGAAGGQFAKAL